jgi:hypothetical protein
MLDRHGDRRTGVTASAATVTRIMIRSGGGGRMMVGSLIHFLAILSRLGSTVTRAPMLELDN